MKPTIVPPVAVDSPMIIVSRSVFQLWREKYGSKYRPKYSVDSAPLSKLMKPCTTTRINGQTTNRKTKDALTSNPTINTGSRPINWNSWIRRRSETREEEIIRQLGS